MPHDTNAMMELFEDYNKEYEDWKGIKKITYILKKELGFTLKEIQEIKAKFPNELINGTKNEIARINNILIKKGIRSIYVKRI